MVRSIKTPATDGSLFPENTVTKQVQVAESTPEYDRLRTMADSLDDVGWEVYEPEDAEGAPRWVTITGFELRREAGTRKGSAAGATN